MIMKASFHGTLPMFFLPPPGMRYKNSILKGRFLTHSLTCFIATHFWHSNVKNDEIRRRRFGELNSGLSIKG